MAETVNRTVLISGYDDGLVELFKKIEEAGTEAYSALSEAANKHTEAIGKMVEKMQAMMDKQAEQQKKMEAAGGGSGSGSGMGFGMAAGVGAGFGAGLGIASFQSIGAMIGTAFTEGRKLDESQRMIYALTGKKGNEDTFAGADIGYSMSELLENQANMMRNAGVTIDGVSNKSRTALEIERGYGLGEGSSASLNQFVRQGAGTSDQIMTKLLVRAADSKIWGVDVDGNGVIAGFPALGEKIQQFTTLTQTQLGVSENTSSSFVSRLMGGFGKIGGQFGDQRAGESIMALHSAISSPANEFVRGDLMSAFAKDDPTMNMFQLQKRMQKGAFGEGNMEVVLKHLEETFTDMDSRMMAIDVFTNKTLTQEGVERLAQEGVWKNFSGLSGRDDIKGMLNKVTGGIGGRAEGATGEVGQTEARVKDTLAEGGLKVINTLSDTIQSFLDGGLELFTNPMHFLGEKLDELALKIKEMLTPRFPNGTPTTPEEWEVVKDEEKEARAADLLELKKKIREADNELAKPDISWLEQWFYSKQKTQSQGQYDDQMKSWIAVYGENTDAVNKNTDALNGKTKVDSNAVSTQQTEK